MDDSILRLSCSACKLVKDVNQFPKSKNCKPPYHNQCKQCVRDYYQRSRTTQLAYHRSYYQTHKERMNANAQQYAEQHREQTRAIKARWRIRNLELARQIARDSAKRSYVADPGKFKHRAKAQRAWRRHKIPVRDLTRQQWREILLRFDNCCAYCMRPFSEDCAATQDHLTPLSRGGMHTASNIVPACINCNSQKQARTYDEFMSHLPPLTLSLPRPLQFDASSVRLSL